MKNFINHFFQQFQSNEHEEREVFETLDVVTENPETEIMDALKTEGKESVAATLIEQNADKPEVLEKVRQQLEAIKGNDAEKNIVNQNLDNLRMRSGVNEGLDKLQNAINTLKPTESSTEVKTEMPEATPLPVDVKSIAPKVKADMPASEAEAKSRFEKIKDWTKEELDTTKWSNEKKATVATLTLGAAALLAYWIYRRNKGKEKNEITSQPEQKSKFPKWLLWIPVIGVSSWFGYKLYQNWKDVKDMADAAKKGIEGGATVVASTVEGMKKGMEGVIEAFGPLGKELITLPNIGPVLNKQYFSDKPYESKAEFLKDAAVGLIADGVQVAYLGGRAAFLIGGKLVWDTGALSAHIGAMITDPSFEHFGQCIVAYTEGGVLYASSVGILRAIKLQNPIPGAKELAMWPVTVVSKGKKVAMGILSGETPEYMADVTKSMGKFWKYQGLRGQNFLRLQKPSLETYQAHKEMWKMFNDMIGRAKGNSVASPRTIQIWEGRSSTMLKNAKKILIQVEKEGKLPPNMMKFLKEDFAGQKIADLDNGSFGKLMRETNAFETVAEETAALTEMELKLANTSDEALEIAKEGGTLLKKAAGAEGMSEAVPTGKPDLKIYNPDEAADIVAAAPEAKTSEELMEQIKAARVAKNDTEIERLLKNPLLKKAAETGDEEAKALVKASAWLEKWMQAKNAVRTGVSGAGKVIKVAGRVAIPLGVALDAYMLYDNEQQLNDAIEKNDSAAIQRLTARSRSLRNTGGVGLVSLAMAGPGVILAAGVAGVALYNEAVYESIAEWEKTKEDYKKEDSATLLSGIHEKIDDYSWGHSAGIGDWAWTRLWKKATYSREAYKNDVAKKHKEMAESNEGMRREMYAAYLAKNSFMPPLAGEDDQTYKERVKEHVRQRMTFMEKMTDNKMLDASPSVLASSDSYAELKEIKTKLEESGQPLKIEYDYQDEKREINLVNLETLEITELSALVHRYHNEVKPQKLIEKWTMLNSMLQETGKDASQIVRIETLHRLRDNINKAEMRIRSTDMNGVADTHEQNVVRAVLCEAVEKDLQALTSQLQSGSLTVETYDAAVQQIVLDLEGISQNAQASYDGAPDALKQKTFSDADTHAVLALAPTLQA